MGLTELKENTPNTLTDSPPDMEAVDYVGGEKPAADGSLIAPALVVPTLHGSNKVRDKVVEKVYEAVLE